MSRNTLLHDFINNNVASNINESIVDIPPLINSAVLQKNNDEGNVTCSISDLTADQISANVNVTQNASMLDTTNASLHMNNVESNATRPKRKMHVKKCFSLCFKILEKEGLVKLHLEAHNKRTKEIHQEGCFVVCMPCEKNRNKSDDVVNLRRQHCEHYFKNQHYTIEAHQACVRTLEDSKRAKSATKVKSYSQSTLHSFFSPVTVKTDTSNEQSISKDNNDLIKKAAPMGSNENNLAQEAACNRSTSEASIRTNFR